MQQAKTSITAIVLLLMSMLLQLQSFSQSDSITVTIRPSYDSVSKTHRFFLGENYRKLWALPVTVKVFHLSKEMGGFKIIKTGGGMQTLSLRLQDANGKEWVLRTLEKYPERKLPDNLKASIVKDIMVDQITTANPFAALTVPPFAAALAIPHASPQIVYVADDPTLGEYRTEFANKVFLFEERNSGSDASADNSEKLEEKLKSDNDVSVDQQMVLRARLLDMLLGDWDRHEDQWRWEKIKSGKSTSYSPIPRDRDQVYYKTSGVFPWIVSHQFLMSKFQGFNSSIRDIQGWNVNARYFDRIFLTGLDEQQWKDQIAFVQNSITDSLINYAIHLLPPPVFALTGEDVIHKLKIRRDNLEKQALDYYHFISKVVDIPQSDKNEQFDITYTDSGKVSLSIYKITKHGEIDKRLYQRTFIPGITKEIRLYGRGGEDVFSVTGTQASPVRIRMIGGDDRDSFHIDPNTSNKQRLYIYDRSDEANSIPLDIKAKKRLEKDSTVNAYQARTFKYEMFGPVFSGDYNQDDRVVLKVGLMREHHSFRKEPYASKQELWLNYSTGRDFYRIIYDGDFKKVIRNNDLTVNLYSRGPHYIRNFFGVGNETVFPDEGDRKISYYRTRFDFVTFETRLRHPLAKHLSVNAGVRFQYYTSDAEHNINNSLEAYSKTYPEKNVFSKQWYAGPVVGLLYDSRNNNTLPGSGFRGQVNVMTMKELTAGKNDYVQFTAEGEYYLGLNKDSTIVLGNRVGLGTTGGTPAFFQLLYLNGNINLRGFRSYRFAGDSYVYHNIELRIKLFDFVSYLLPGTVGITFFNDLGRVWVPGESSSAWHDGYGAGLYVRPANLPLILLQLAHSTEGWQPYLNFGFRF